MFSRDTPYWTNILQDLAYLILWYTILDQYLTGLGISFLEVHHIYLPGLQPHFLSRLLASGNAV